MNPVVITAVLLLMVGLQDPVHGFDVPKWFCGKYYPENPCGYGWSRIDENRCAKYIRSPKTFSDAQEHCRTFNSDLVSEHNPDEMMNVLCLNVRDGFQLQPFWIGAERSGEDFIFTDGSDFDYSSWYPGQPDNAGGQEDCVESNYRGSRRWNDANCSEEKNFVCAKKM